MASNPGFTSVLSSRAQKEISESWEWYEERQAKNTANPYISAFSPTSSSTTTSLLFPNITLIAAS